MRGMTAAVPGCMESDSAGVAAALLRMQERGGGRSGVCGRLVLVPCGRPGHRGEDDRNQAKGEARATRYTSKRRPTHHLGRQPVSTTVVVPYNGWGLCNSLASKR